MACLQAFPSSLLPRAGSRALIPFPFERLPHILGNEQLTKTSIECNEVSPAVSPQF